MSVSARTRVLAGILAAAALLGVTGCAPAGAISEQVEPTVQPVYPDLGAYPDIDVVEDVAYGTADGSELLLDVCLPAADPLAERSDEAMRRAAVLSVHGGSWSRGDKANINWRTVCRWLASEGFVAFSVNYRLAPTSTFPAPLDDLQQVVRWIREPAQAELFGIDPARVAAFGGSAGGNLVSLLGTVGDGPVDAGARVAAVAQLSGPADLTDAGRELGGLTADFEQAQLAYLGCAALTDCPSARDASPLYQVDPTDPPFFVGHSTDELIPVEQSEALVEELRSNAIEATFVTVDGSLHSIGMLDERMRERIVLFLRGTLGDDGAVG